MNTCQSSQGFLSCSAPVALLTFLAPGGEPKMVAANWIWIVCSRPAVLSATLEYPADRFWPAAGGFTVNYLTDAQLEKLAWQERLEQKAGRLPEDLGFTLDRGSDDLGPGIAECPIRIECRAVHLPPYHRRGQVSGKVTAIRLEGEVYGPEKAPDLFQLQPFTRRAPLPHLPVSLADPACTERLRNSFSFS